MVIDLPLKIWPPRATIDLPDLCVIVAEGSRTYYGLLPLDSVAGATCPKPTAMTDLDWSAMRAPIYSCRAQRA